MEAGTGIVRNFAGTGIRGYNGTGIPATSAQIGNVSAVADAAGNIYLTESDNNFIRRISSATGMISVVAGTGASGFSPDNTPAATAIISQPQAIALGSNGDVYFIEGNRVRMIAAATGLLVTVAGTGNYGFAGDGSSAPAASLGYPEAVALDAAGNIFIGEQNLDRIRKVTKATGIISTIVGGGGSGDGGPATNALFTEPMRAAIDSAGNTYIVDTLAHRVRRIDGSTGTITTFAGNGFAQFGGDSGPAASANLNYPSSVAVDGADNVYIGDSGSSRVRMVSAATGIISTVAGSASGYGGDGGPALQADFGNALGIALDGNGNLYIADADNARIRKVDATNGVVHTVAGTGSRGFSGDGGLAVNGQIGYVVGIAVDPAGTIYIADEDNLRLRKVDAVTGIITTIAGTGTWDPRETAARLPRHRSVSSAELRWMRAAMFSSVTMQ